MPAPRTVLRGVQNIRTISGRVDESATPYKAYMKLSMLEMEKYRRAKEKTMALEKVRLIDQRFQEIEEEKQLTLQRLGTQAAPPPDPAVTRSRPRRSATGRLPASAAPLSSTGPFKIKY